MAPPVQWLRDGLKIIRASSEVEALEAEAPDNGGVYLVPAFAGLGAPHWDARPQSYRRAYARRTNLQLQGLRRASELDNVNPGTWEGEEA